METKVEIELAGRRMILTTGKLGRQADGSVTLQYGETVVFAAAVSSKEERRESDDMLPLTVDYREKTYAAGKFPGGFKKREGPPSTREILTMRLIDRPARPLFPENYFKEISISTIVLSSDKENYPDVLALIAASAATCISTIPFGGPIGAVRVGKIDGQMVVNPTRSQLTTSTMDIIVAGTREATVMIEGGANEVPENEVLEAILFGQAELQKTIDLQMQLIEKAGRPKQKVEPASFNEELFGKIMQDYAPSVREALKTNPKMERRDALSEIKDRITEAYTLPPESPRATEQEINGFWNKMMTKIVRDVTMSGSRVDGRGYEEIRDLTIEVGVLPRTHGSALFQRGETQALNITTLGSRRDEQKVDALEEESYRKFMLHYNFPAFCVGEAWPNRGPKRREIGHGSLAERSLEAVLPDPDEFPYTIRVVCDIMESNGSSSMASVCGGTLCLMDAGVPIKRPVAGISIGLVKEGERWVTLTDIVGDEDHYGDMDFKVAGSQKGVTGIQLDIKIKGLSREIIERALHQAREARMKILRSMLSVIDRPRSAIAEHAPRLKTIQINPEKIGKVIGPGGKMINGIQDQTGVVIEIDEDNSGRILLFGPDTPSVSMAEDMILRLTEEAQIGKTYDGCVTTVKDFGCFVEILPGTDGLVHISELGDGFVKEVSDVAKLGDRFRVKVIAIDNQGRIKLSKKQADR